MHNFLDAFYLSRIGIRMLIGQYLELREPPKHDHIGLVCLVRGVVCLLPCTHARARHRTMHWTDLNTPHSAPPPRKWP